MLTDGGDYEEHFTADDYLPLHGFLFNRIGFLVGQLAQADSVSLSDVDVTVTRAVPEPGTSLMSLVAMLFIGGGLRARR